MVVGPDVLRRKECLANGQVIYNLVDVHIDENGEVVHLFQ
jgi:hypothetical protein